MSGLSDPTLQARVDRYQRRKKRAPIVVVVCIVLLAAGLVWYGTYDTNRANARLERLNAVEARANALEANYATLYEQFEECTKKQGDDAPECEEPVVPPVEDIKPDPAPTSTTTVIRQAVSPAQVRTAVDRFCQETGDCEGDRPTLSQTVQAVTRYCSERNDCTADPLPPIQPSPGPTGAPGERGPGPTDEQVLAAVRAFCAEGNCRGKDADEIVNFACTGGLGTLRLTLEFASGRTLVRECTATPTEPSPTEPTEPTEEPTP